jgi:hypothetical protein
MATAKANAKANAKATAMQMARSAERCRTTVAAESVGAFWQAQGRLFGRLSRWDGERCNSG